VLPMTPSTKKQTAVRLEPELLEGLQTLKERDGILISEQVRRAVRAWLESRGVIVSSKQKRKK
jgi:predicted DNA-binding protein